MARGVKDADRTARSQLIVERVLNRAMRKGWTVPKTAAVLLASLSPKRVAAGVVGPCFYCFDDLAATVDHIKPSSQGGTDDRRNLVSACSRCNDLKSTTSLARFLYLYPFGSDRARNIAARDWLRDNHLEPAEAPDQAMIEGHWWSVSDLRESGSVSLSPDAALGGEDQMLEALG